MNLTYYSFPPFAIDKNRVTVIDTATQRVYRDLTLGLQDRADTVYLSNDSFETIELSKGSKWYGDPMLTLDLNVLFQKKLQAKLTTLLAEDQVVQMADDLRRLLSQLLADSYLMDVPLELPEIPGLAKLIKFSNIQLTSELNDDAYAIIETLIKVLLELNDHKLIVLTNVSHYLSSSQLQMLVRFMANADLPLLLIEFSPTKRTSYFKECDYHFIDDDFVLW
ncbi:type II-A CRISPR-associated protein Csn2 [Levilactobacillus enshiensis]|uniref:type II-A CRISPR-associated protein Csn2 n=1 Tax=Levilactobacillus enshiensis TaxID=2590213 RepID=UPI00117BA6A2|nr:type II-A CRISPR-associated protein Csn2 [Levilactobacillus enshiensis]